ncbi:MAG: hypothetical protein DSY42_05125 [Aquifex sp.]|nr:MAG: hypothetical protein DSY42_05125 [Aquifex sp.]
MLFEKKVPAEIYYGLKIDEKGVEWKIVTEDTGNLDGFPYCRRCNKSFMPLVDAPIKGLIIKVDENKETFEFFNKDETSDIAIIARFALEDNRSLVCYMINPTSVEVVIKEALRTFEHLLIEYDLQDLKNAFLDIMKENDGAELYGVSKTLMSIIRFYKGYENESFSEDILNLKKFPDLLNLLLDKMDKGARLYDFLEYLKGLIQEKGFITKDDIKRYKVFERL